MKLRRLAALGAFISLLGVLIATTRPISAGAEGGGALVAEPIVSASAAGVRQLFGASPLESPSEVWGLAEGNEERLQFVHYVDGPEWQAVPGPVGPDGRPLTLTYQQIPSGAAAGRTTAAGGVVTVAAPGPSDSEQDLIIRDPGGSFRAVPEPGEPVRLEGEELFLDRTDGVDLAAVEEPGGSTGAFVVPYLDGKLSQAVLHYDGAEWTREPICFEVAPTCVGPEPGFKVFRVEAAGPGQAWLLGRSGEEPLILFHRQEGVWLRQPLGGDLGAIFSQRESTVAGSQVQIKEREVGQPLTVTSKGVWVDAEVRIGSGPTVDATIYRDSGEGDPQDGEVTGSWCDLPTGGTDPAQPEVCEFPLGSDLADGSSRSFAWPGTSAKGDFGTRAITGIGQGAMLVFENGGFSRIPLDGNGGTEAGAALSATDRGWIGPSYRLTREPIPSGLTTWPLPFRRPLLAIAGQPGAAVASTVSQAVAVGAEGEVARYLPGIGWQPETLLSSTGTRATPVLRAVAWPEPGFAYAVGDEGAMWLWRGSTGFWEPDPAAPPNLIRGNFTGIAFDPNDPSRGYAVGKQGLLLRYGRRWTPEALPPELNPEINLTSIAFAGSEAIATWTLAVPPTEGLGQQAKYIGGVIVNEGAGWRVEEAATDALESVESSNLRGVAPWLVSGLPDGGAVIVGLRGSVVEREAAGAPWFAPPGAPLGNPSAVAALREGGQVRAVVAAGRGGTNEEVDRAQATGQPAEGQPPLITEPYRLPQTGYLIRQTASGWRDEQRQAYPLPPEPTDQEELAGEFVDLPREADPILALLISPDGSGGWVVGGQTGENAAGPGSKSERLALQTASVLRYGPGAAPPPNVSAATIPTSSTEATFAIGGEAQCVGACADLAGVGIGPDVWLPAAVSRAAAIPGVRAFLYAGSGVSEHLDLGDFSPSEFAAEEKAYARRLGAGAGALPVFAAPAETDLYGSSLSLFGSAFAGFPAPLGTSVGAGTAPLASGNRAAGNYSYSFNSLGNAGTVRVIVLDQSVVPLATEKQCWLAEQLASAKEMATPAIVVGSRDVESDPSLAQLLVTGADSSCAPANSAGASAFFYELRANRTGRIQYGSASIPSFGTGTLGYQEIANSAESRFEPASGFLLASVNVAARSATTNVAPVTARLIPNVGSLAIDAIDGTLLRRSQTALFRALARRPLGGGYCTGNQAPLFCYGRGPNPYISIPSRCLFSATCPAEILPEYSFASSRPDIANFVAVDPNSTDPRAALLKNGKPVPDPTSGLLCAFNSGSTVVSIEAGGLAYSVPVTVQSGSVARPCGTVPRTDIPAAEPALETPPAPPPAPAPSPSPSPSPSPPPPPSPSPAPPTPSPPAPPVAPAPKPAPPAQVQAPAPPFLPASAPGLAPAAVIVPPPPPPAVEPTPPTGTSPVAEPASSPEKEEEDEAAYEDVHNAVAVRRLARTPAVLAAHRQGGGGLPDATLPALILLAAIGFAGISGSRRRPAPEFAQSRSIPRRRRPR